MCQLEVREQMNDWSLQQILIDYHYMSCAMRYPSRAENKTAKQTWRSLPLVELACF